MIRRLCVLLLLGLLAACSGGGSSSSSSGGPAPGPQTVSLRLQVETPSQRVLARGTVRQIVVEVVEPGSSDTSTISRKRLVARGTATVPASPSTSNQSSPSPSNQLVEVLILDVLPGTWEIHVFGLDEQGTPVAGVTPFPATLVAGGVFFRVVTLGSLPTPTTPTTPVPVPVSVAVSPTNAVLLPGQTQQFTALVTLSDSTTTSTGVTWSSSNPALATVDANGLATAVAPGGPINIVATTANGVSGSGQLTVNPPAVVLQQINVSYVAPTANPLTLGQAGVALQAQGLFSDGTTQDLTQQVTWSSGDPAVATVSNAAGTQGQITVVASGTTNVTAALAGVTSAPFAVTVSPQRVVVVTSNGAASEVRSYTLDGAGALTPVTVPGINLPEPPRNLTYHSSGNFAYVDTNSAGNPDPIRLFRVSAAGALTSGGSLLEPFLGNGRGLIADTGLAYASGENTPGNDGVQPYQIDPATGNLTATGPQFVGFNLPDRLTLKPFTGAPQFLFLSQFGAPNSIRGFQLDASGNPTVELAGSPQPLVSSVNVFDLALNTTGNFLITTLDTGTDQQIRVLPANPGLGAPVFSAIVTSAREIAVSPNGRHVFLLRIGGTNELQSYTIDNNTGQLTLNTFAALPANGLSDIAVDSTGRFLLLIEQGAPIANGVVKVIEIDQATGNFLAPLRDIESIPGAVFAEVRR